MYSQMDQNQTIKVLYQGKEFPVIREMGDYLVCQLENSELELVVKRSEVQIAVPEESQK